MAQNNWLDMNRAGLAANLPATTWATGTVFSNNSTPGTPSTGVNEAPSYPGNQTATYYATDTNVTYQWNPATQAWVIQPGAAGLALIAAAGQTQGTATAITNQARRVIVTAVATATHNGIKLPVAVTGLEVEIVSGVSGGFKVYPALHNFIQAGASNAADATNVAAFKSNTYIAVNATTWAVQRGA